MGSIVTLQTQSVPEGVPKFLLIDGQQRLTTTFILLTLLRDTARREGRAELAEEIEQTLLVNRFKKGDDHAKLLPTQTDRPAFLQLMQEPGTIPSGRIGAAYSFLERKLRTAGIDIEVLDAGRSGTFFDSDVLCIVWARCRPRICGLSSRSDQLPWIDSAA